MSRKWFCIVLLVQSLVLGAFVLPAIHHAHCPDGHGADSEGCSLCQFAGTPLLAAPATTPPTIVRISFRPWLAPRLFVPAGSGQDVTRARAPPA